MVGRKSMILPQILLILLAIGWAYNTMTMLMHKESHTRKRLDCDGFDLLDPGTKKDPKSNVRFHVVVTASDTPYSKWQCRVMYYWYKRFRYMPKSDMGGFTRLLHSGKPDNLVDEIPTVIVDPLPDGLDQGYVVLNRPWAFVQWLETTIIEEHYILMADPDHIFVNPMPNLAHGDIPAAFPFLYINPLQNQKVIRKYYPEKLGPITDVDPIGSSPVIIKKSILKQIVPTWMNVSLKMKNDPETDKAFGWVLEMYGYAVASALNKVQHVLHKKIMLQPPYDLEVAKKYIIHYTYGCDYNMEGVLLYDSMGEWRFNKRSYLTGPPPRNLSLPPPGAPNSVVQLIKMINEATANIPGWDDT